VPTRLPQLAPFGTTNLRHPAGYFISFRSRRQSRNRSLQASGRLDHCGKLRLGRSGPDRSGRQPDNVWDADCLTLIAPDARDIHPCCVEEPKTVELTQAIVKGVDRKVPATMGLVPA
jgi:hypothetical protein